MNLLNNIKITTLFRGSTATSATDKLCTANHVDMSGFEGCLLLSSVVDVTGGISTGGFQLRPYHSNSTASTSFTALGTTAIAGISATLSTAMLGGKVAVDVYKPLKRYLSCSIIKAGAASSLTGPVLAIQYGQRTGAITQSTAGTQWLATGTKTVISPTT